ncbi:hypothetical protein [Isoptericola cucumis]|uniref:hypothetical protein n=1 Tax=Isoptericola cucumis TaxID=1776856 RepID=UPI001668CF73|nr:hypothetical protein [Isoptericola cucumis]
MGERLQLDLDGVRDTASRLGSIGSALEGAETAANELATMIGHPALARAVGTFGNNWDAARTELIEKLDGLQQATGAVADMFTDADAELARAAEGER